MKRIPPAVALLFLAPVLGELVSGHQAPRQFFDPILFLVLALPYGCGALLCRDFARRWRAGWPGLLLLGVAYALWEEGLVSRALFDPHWRESGLLAQYDHVAGINWTYGIMLVHFHVAISIFASVTLAELAYPALRDRPWLSGRQAVLCGAVLAAWAPVLALLARTDQPLFVPPPSLWLPTGVAILGLVVAARRIRAPTPRRTRERVPGPAWFLTLGAVNMTAVFTAVFILPEAGVRPPLSVTVAFLLALDAATLWLLVRDSGGGATWDDRHRLALVAGLLAFFVVFGVLSDLERFEGKSLVSLATAVALVRGWRVVRRRTGTGRPGAALTPG